MVKKKLKNVLNIIIMMNLIVLLELKVNFGKTNLLHVLLLIWINNISKKSRTMLRDFFCWEISTRVKLRIG